VTLKDVFGDTLFSVNTEDDGKITTQEVLYKIYEYLAGTAGGTYDTDITTHSPHTLTITKAGYQTYEDVITIDRKMDLEIALAPYVPVNPIKVKLSTKPRLKVKLNTSPNIKVRLS